MYLIVFLLRDWNKLSNYQSYPKLTKINGRIRKNMQCHSQQLHISEGY